MDNISIEATERSPKIELDFGKNVYSLSGESYPEDVTAFFGPIMEKLESHFEGLEGADILFNFELIYFNSSSAKIIMGLFDMLEEVAEEGNKVNITWTFEEDDDNMEELGEEFGEDLEAAKFKMKAVKV